MAIQQKVWLVPPEALHLEEVKELLSDTPIIPSSPPANEHIFFKDSDFTFGEMLGRGASAEVIAATYDGSKEIPSSVAVKVFFQTEGTLSPAAVQQASEVLREVQFAQEI